MVETSWYKEYLAMQKALRRVRYMLCLNIVVNMTHRERNNHLDEIVREISESLANPQLYADLDDIPF